MKLGDIISFIEKKAPLNLQEAYDNSGLILGSPADEISKVLVCLDADEGALEYAIQNNCQLILSHHPAVFRAIKVFTGEIREARLITKAIRHNIAIYSAHTNFDSALGGLTDSLCEMLGLQDYRVLKSTSMPDASGHGRYGTIPRLKGEEFLDLLVKRLELKALRLVGQMPQWVSKVAVFNGAYDGDILSELVKIKPDAFITGDLKFHDAQMLSVNNIFTIDAGHYGTEKHFVDQMTSLLENNFPEITVLGYKGEDVFSYFVAADI